MPSRVTLAVPEVSCATGQRAIEGAVAALPGVSAAHVDRPAKTVTVGYDPPAARADIDTATEHTGYQAAGPARTSAW